MILEHLRQLNLKTRIALATAVIFAGLVSVLTWLGLRYFESEFRNRLYSQQYLVVSTLASNLDDKLRVAQMMLASRAQVVPPEVLLDADTAQKHLDDRVALKAVFDNGVFLISPEGRLIAESPYRAGRRGLDISNREFVQESLKTRKPYISKPFIPRYANGQPALVMTAPIFDARGKLIGIFEGSLNLMGQNFLADLNKVKVGQTGYLYLADQDRIMIAHPNPARIMKRAAEPGQNVLFDRAYAGFEGTDRTTTTFGAEMYTSFKRVPLTGWILGANYPAAEAEEPIRRARRYVYLILGVGGGVVLLLTWLSTRQLLKPLARLTAHVQALPGKAASERRLELRADSEVSSLVRAFNNMVDTLDQQQKDLRDSEARFRSLAEMSSDWYWEQDANFRFTLMSRGVDKTNVTTGLGQTRWELPIEGVTSEQWAEHRAMLERHERFRDFVYQVRTLDGELRVFSISGAPVFDAQGQFTGYRGVGSDITDRKSAEQRIQFLAYHDALTSLPNRLLVRDRYTQALAQAERRQRKVALVYLDLDNFKTINDTLGHAAGDNFLQEVAQRLSSCVRETDTVSREGGDEFLLVLNDLADADSATAVVLKAMKQLQRPLLIGDQEVSSSASVGIAIGPDDGRDFETLRKKADRAMYRSKESGRNTYHFFNPAMDAEASEHLALRNGLRRALERGEFLLYYQPQYELASGRLSGVEALLRWDHPEWGFTLPGRFIGMAEDSGLIVPIGEWVLHEACHQAMAWQRAGLAPLTISVNLSAIQFKRGRVQESVATALAASGLDPRWLELEFTESILIENTEDMLESVRQLKQLHLKLAIDDFGTGYSSLSYLKRLDIDRLKIDQSFVRDLTTNHDDAAIVRAIIQMAQSLGLQTIAEGVENEETAQKLRDDGCEQVQGYHYARPMPAAQLERLLSARRTS